MDKNEIINTLLEPNRTNTNNIKLKREFQAATDGMRSSWLITNYGCERCAINKMCEYYPHSNKMCVKRGKLYVEYFKAGKGEVVPLMIDQLAKLSTERDIEHQKGIEKGTLTEEYFRLNYLCMLLQEKIHKATEGTKLKVEHTWIDELRNAKKIIDTEYGSHNSSKSGTEKEISGEVSESSEDSE